MTQKSLSKKTISWKLMKELSFISFITILINILSAIAWGMSPFFISKTVDYAIKGDAIQVNKWVIYSIILISLLITFVTLEMIINNFYIARAKRVLRSNYAHNIFLKNISEFRKGGKGTHWDYLTETSSVIAHQYFMGVVNMVKSFVTLMAAFISIALLNIYIALILVALCIFSKTILIIFDKKLKARTEQKAKTRRQYNEELNDLTTGIETLFWNDSIDALSRRVENANLNLQKSSISFFKTDSIFKYINDLIASLVIDTILVVIAVFAFKIDHSVVGLFVGIFIALSIFQEGLNDLVKCFIETRRTKPLRTNANYFKNTSYKNKKISSWFSESIQVKNLSFSYEDKLILKDINFEIKNNEKIAIVGKSGSGKSTLLNLILNQIQPDNGLITMDGRNISTIEEQEYLSNISYSNNHNLILNESFENNMSLFGGGPYKLKDLKEKFNLNFIKKKSDQLDKKTLSTGQQQRVNLARVWVNRKPILILDECFGNLDKENASSILENILKEKDITIIMISHHLTPTQIKMFDQVINL